MIVAVVAVAAVYWFYVRTPTGQGIDGLAHGDLSSRAVETTAIAEVLLNVVSVASAAVAILVVVGVAVARRRPATAVAAIVVVAGANATTQLLKKIVLERPALGEESWWQNSLPSGHTTIVASLAFAMLIAVPLAWRNITTWLGAGFTVAIGVSTIMTGWHRPSDVVAALLVATAWCMLVVACGGADVAGPTADRPSSGFARKLVGRPSRTATTSTMLLWAGAVGAGIGVVVQVVIVALGINTGTSTISILAYTGGIVGAIGVGAWCFGVVLVVLDRNTQGKSTKQRVEAGLTAASTR